VSVILGVENGERERGTAVIWIPAEAYYSAITTIFEMQLWKKLDKKYQYIAIQVDLPLACTTY